MKAEIEEVVTLANRPDEFHNRYISRHTNSGFHNMEKYKLDYAQPKRLLANINVPFYVNEKAFDMYIITDWKMLRDYCSFGNFYPHQFKHTMNIRLQYSKKVKNDNNKKGKPIWHSAHPEEKLT